ncbi:hypothetical protein WKW77_34225 [Variovorax ureilyticus]|uniref:Uncharacterized protein n=1 Tax=Variovorax ureilyticus TaxID=1836198 RepID=A0ABU8VRN9_9BURK
MPKSQSRRKGAAVKGPPVKKALEKNKQVAEEVKEAADELGVVHAVLDTKVPEDARHEDVGEAIARTKEVAKRLDKSAEVLDEVNEALEREAETREALQGGAKPSQ